jgi:hypothetical protein
MVARHEHTINAAEPLAPNRSAPNSAPLGLGGAVRPVDIAAALSGVYIVLIQRRRGVGPSAREVSL